MNVILIIGGCGTGKTWIMNRLKEHFDISNVYHYGTGLYTYLKKDGVIILGRYDGSTFEGGDKLSMAIMSDNDKVKPVFEEARVVFAEGDRFTNSSFIEAFAPRVYKITNDGAAGREKRKSSQTERHIRAIQSRVDNIKADREFATSAECLEAILEEFSIT